MKVRKAVITAAARRERHIPVQSLVDQNGHERSILAVLVDQVVAANIEEVCVVVCPGDEAAYAKAAGDQAGRIRFIAQPEPLGYAHAIYCAREFAGNEPFLHLVGDHAYVRNGQQEFAATLVDAASRADCSVSAVQVTRESLLPYYGAVGGERVAGHSRLYRISTVYEKPDPTIAELDLRVSGLRAGFYLCFCGMHVLTPAAMEILGHVLATTERPGLSLSAALARLARQEEYLALEATGMRINLGTRYGIFNAQLAFGLTGCGRAQILENLVEMLAMHASPSASRS